MKLIDLSQAIQAAETHPDPIIKMALKSFLNGLPAVEPTGIIDALKTLVTRCVDLCEICANACPILDDGDCDGPACKRDCPCAGCDDGSKWIWRGYE